MVFANFYEHIVFIDVFLLPWHIYLNFQFIFSDQIPSTSERLAPKSQDQQQQPQTHHHHHHHHQSSERQKESAPERLGGGADYKSSTREINKELLERLAQVSSARDDTGALGPLILRKRRSKSRGKGVAPLAPLVTQPTSPTEATETTQMLESTEDREMSTERSDRSDKSERSDRSERKRPPPRPRDYLWNSLPFQISFPRLVETFGFWELESPSKLLQGWIFPLGSTAKVLSFLSRCWDKREKCVSRVWPRWSLLWRLVS